LIIKVRVIGMCNQCNQNMNHVYLLLIGVLFYTNMTTAYAQTAERNWILRGYVKNLQTVNFLNLDTAYIDHLIHNRLNFKWYINEQFTFALEGRTRLFYGDNVRLQAFLHQQLPDMPTFGQQIERSNDDFFPLSATLIDKQSVVLHSMIDRAYIDWVKNSWELRLGRQRINWGINLAWNPNDLFNTFSFFDFDYEERPGSDALRVQYYTGTLSSIDVAIKVFDKWEDAVAAGLYKFNTGNYDLQVLAGIYQQNIALGGGWAGGIKQVGFKGEFTYFIPYTNTANLEQALAAAISFDYLKDDWFGSLGFLYNSSGLTSGVLDMANNANLLNFSPSARNLYIYQWAIFAQNAYTFTPSISASLSLIYSPGGDNALFINPSISYSIKENWDIDCIGQIFLGNQHDNYTNISQSIFTRLKYSF